MDSKTTTLPDHLSASYDGGLYDSRKRTTVRSLYSRHVSRITRPCEVAACLRAGKHAWPGGYPLYFVCADGEALSFDAVRQNWREIVSAMSGYPDRQWQIIGCEVNWEDAELFCAHSGERIPSAYAES